MTNIYIIEKIVKIQVKITKVLNTIKSVTFSEFGVEDGVVNKWKSDCENSNFHIYIKSDKINISVDPKVSRWL